MDAAACRAFMALTWSRNAGGMRIVLIAVGVFGAAYGVFKLAARPGEPAGPLVFLFCMAALAFFLAFFGYLLRTGRYTRRQQELWGGKTLEKEVLFYGDHFIQKTRLGEMRFAYPQITGASFGRRGVVLFFGNEALYVSRHGFGGKSEAEKFKAFLKARLA